LAEARHFELRGGECSGATAGNSPIESDSSRLLLIVAFRNGCQDWQMTEHLSARYYRKLFQR
jgi:hypothetical protein